MANQTLHVQIISPQQLLLDTNASSVSSKNLQGAFDILPQHTNFITMVEKSPIIVRIPHQKPIIFKFDLAIVLVSGNKVSIYTYIQPQIVTKL